MTAIEIAKIKLGHTFENGGKTAIFVFHCVAEAIARGIKIGKQSFDVMLGWKSVRRGFDCFKYSRQVSIQAFVVVSLANDIDKKLAWIDKITPRLNGIILDFAGNPLIGQFCIINAAITAFHVVGKVLADETVKKSAKHILFKIPSVYCTSHIIGDLPDLALKRGALLSTCHSDIPMKAGLKL
ncbi:hypothetical protein LEP1GSC008_3281 [Leptospira kirschneri serovar Bulgarica str. Nikolaevo]|uniref:Uncharacterized protein n=1 Tax=Leptospira kirschneri serovar Bulgarica str. Nikolaevo TaxID=1240687 RepID=M6F3R2_9LEPT|nr:hypothetical protein LEP1GSC008_3281 [Leptospira kirschneri serovar Bulgarica str. Nikolaevo]